MPRPQAPWEVQRINRACYAYGPDGELLELLEEYDPNPPSTPLGP